MAPALHAMPPGRPDIADHAIWSSKSPAVQILLRLQGAKRRMTGIQRCQIRQPANGNLAAVAPECLRAAFRGKAINIFTG